MRLFINIFVVFMTINKTILLRSQCSVNWWVCCDSLLDNTHTHAGRLKLMRNHTDWIGFMAYLGCCCWSAIDCHNQCVRDNLLVRASLLELWCAMLTQWVSMIFTCTAAILKSLNTSINSQPPLLHSEPLTPATRWSSFKWRVIGTRESLRHSNAVHDAWCSFCQDCGPCG